MTKHYITRIYELSISGIPAKKICSIIRRDKAQVSRVIKALISHGYLYCINPNSKVKIYEATSRKFSGEKTTVDSITSSCKKPLVDYGGYYTRCHGLRYRASIKSWGKEPNYLDDQWETKGTIHFLYHQSFNGLSSEPVSFIRHKSKYSDTLSIILPDRYFNTMRDGDVGIWLFGQVRKVVSWFCREYDTTVCELRECSGVSHAISVRHPELVRLAQERTIYFGEGYVLDASHGAPELEGPEDLMRELFRLIPRVDALEKRVARIEDSVEKIAVSIERVTVAVDRLTRLFDAPKKEDELRDVT